jgi:hypothetical protein
VILILRMVPLVIDLCVLQSAKSMPYGIIYILSAHLVLQYFVIEQNCIDMKQPRRNGRNVVLEK